MKFIQALGPETLLIELGSGSSTKTRVLLEDFLKIHKKCTYIPIDISKEVLVNSSRGLLADYQELNIVAIHSKYDDALKYIADNFKDKSKLIIFLGGSIGNMSMEEEIKFLSRIRESNFFLKHFFLKK